VAHKKPLTFEQALNRLEEIVEQMERGDLPLDASLALFQEGVELSRICTRRLNEAEERIHKLVRVENGKFYLEPLPSLRETEPDAAADETAVSEPDAGQGPS
jgi:exodeoxyribonuclease VII small subunit